jgi:hypothetical protein
VRFLAVLNSRDLDVVPMISEDNSVVLRPKAKKQWVKPL